MAGFEWDPEKESLNVEKHRFDFTTASQIWDGPLVENVDERRDYGEIRIIATGMVDGCVLVVYTRRGETRRIISARKANSREKGLFEEEIARRSRAPPD